MTNGEPNFNRRASDKSLGTKTLETIVQGGVPQTGVLVALITTMSQPFGTDMFKLFLDKVLHLGEIAPFSIMIAAMAISLIFAVWIVRFGQKLCGGKCFITILLVWITLFSMSFGANNSLKENPVENEEIARLTLEKESLENLNERMEKDLSDTLKELKSIQDVLGGTNVSHGGKGPWWDRFHFISQAHAQETPEELTGKPDEPQLTEEKREAIRKLEELTRRLELLQEYADKERIAAEMPAVAGDKYPNKIMF